MKTLTPIAQNIILGSISATEARSSLHQLHTHFTHSPVFGSFIAQPFIWLVHCCSANSRIICFKVEFWIGSFAFVYFRKWLTYRNIFYLSSSLSVDYEFMSDSWTRFLSFVKYVAKVTEQKFVGLHHAVERYELKATFRRRPDPI